MLKSILRPRLRHRGDKSDFTAELERRIGFVIKDEALYRKALTHSSTNKTDRKGEKMNNERMEFLGDALLNAITSELIYKVFLDFGYDKCRDFVADVFRRFSVIEEAVEGTISFKSALMEWGQKECCNIEFDLVAQERMEDNRIRFCTRTLIDGEEYGAGIGFSKREAEQMAAKQALLKIGLPLPE